MYFLFNKLGIHQTGSEDEEVPGKLEIGCHHHGLSPGWYPWRKTSETRKPGQDSTSRGQVVIEKWVMWEVVLMLEKI